mgnify:CR=1 FL=1
MSDPVKKLEEKFNKIRALYEDKSINESEYIDLLEGLEIQEDIALNAKQMEEKVKVQIMIMNTINVVKALI